MCSEGGSSAFNLKSFQLSKIFDVSYSSMQMEHIIRLDGIANSPFAHNSRLQLHNRVAKESES